MRISDWSSDVCSSDLLGQEADFFDSALEAAQCGFKGLVFFQTNDRHVILSLAVKKLVSDKRQPVILAQKQHLRLSFRWEPRQHTPKQLRTPLRPQASNGCGRMLS